LFTLPIRVSFRWKLNLLVATPARKKGREGKSVARPWRDRFEPI